ncbi:Rad22 Rti1 [Schizosaccharomyces octosporus yFS286]|uniref:Rad22 Rti1 n=1 Tax=Schizosaccharomyces octosporus (strain yFS286) TaxID=483514 RepID=S9Q1L5_SCHOY|nr:Rad22 Rti1 [Schizosaccharomyces octosporus yFS286]EPX75176.1 Rad22 Rti1 [Schizosaccharomyces octosporus yFS286]
MEQHDSKNSNAFGNVSTVYNPVEHEEMSKLLSMQLGPEYISRRSGPGGSSVTYLEAWKAIELANEIFGFNGWSSSIQSIHVDYVDESKETQKYSIGLSVIVRVTLKDGTFHEDIGYGSIDNCRAKALAFEKCKKEGTTDGLKRALRNFGSSMGNCLYDKNYIQRISRMATPKSEFNYSNLLQRNRPRRRTSSLRPLSENQTATSETKQPIKPEQISEGNSNTRLNNLKRGMKDVFQSKGNEHSVPNTRLSPELAHSETDMYADEELDTFLMHNDRPLMPESPRVDDFEEMIDELEADDPLQPPNVVDSSSNNTSNQPDENIPVQFMNARAALAGENSNKDLRFQVHKTASSIPKSSGIDHSRSMPTRRSFAQ